MVIFQGYLREWPMRLRNSGRNPEGGADMAKKLTKKQIEHLQQRLLRERDRALRSLGQYDELAKESAEQNDSDSYSYSDHMADLGTDAMEREKMMLFASKEGRYLYRVEDALRRRPYNVLRGSRVVEVRHENATKGHATLELLKRHDQVVRHLEVAEIAGDPHVAHHGPTDEGHLPSVGVRAVQDLLDAVHVAGEAGDDHPPRGGAEHGLDRGGQLPLGHGEAGDLGVGGVGHEQVDPLLAEPGEGAEVGDAVVERELVHLEVAGVQDQARVGADRHREAVGDGVVHRDELQVERPHLGPLALLDLPELRLDPVLLELGVDERQRQLRTDHGDVGAFPQQVGHTPDVVLVPVRQHDRDDVVEPVIFAAWIAVAWILYAAFFAAPPESVGTFLEALRSKLKKQDA